MRDHWGCKVIVGISLCIVVSMCVCVGNDVGTGVGGLVLSVGARVRVGGGVEVGIEVGCGVGECHSPLAAEIVFEGNPLS